MKKNCIMKMHKNLDVWKESITFVTDVYHLTQRFPKTEIYGLTSQIRRAAVSIPANISEGAARNHSREFIRYLRISLGSLSELETLLVISSNLGYMIDDEHQAFQGKVSRICAQLTGLIRSISKYT